MNVLLITQVYPPEVRAISYMMRDLAEELTSRHHKVTVITAWPVKDLTIGTAQRHVKTYSVENGVKVVRVKTPSGQKVGYITKGFIQLSLPRLFTKKIDQYVDVKIESVLAYSPPLPLGLLGIQIKKKYGAKYILNIQDIFPQNAIDLGIMKNPILIKFFERMERKIYRYADNITCHTRNSRKFLIENKQIPTEKITTVSNWFDLDSFAVAKEKGSFREKYGLKDNFIFLFAGVMGPSQNLDFVIDVARQIAEVQEICFLLVGEGKEKKRLQQKVKNYRLENVKFQPLVSKEQYPSLVKEANVGLACLSNKNTTPVMPGKIVDFMASSIPTLAFLNKESDGHDIIRESNCGYSAVSDDSVKAASLVLKMYQERDILGQIGRNGFTYASEHFSKEACVDKLEKLMDITRA